ncbi:MAG: hypothetical protein U1F16_09180 [Turneriella sp.]
MQSLGEILRYDDPAYLRYLSRKTQYLITQEKTEFIHRFWLHLITEYHPRNVLPKLSASDRRAFNELLKTFSHDTRSTMRKRYQNLEKKIPWVLQHPEGGHFIPYEIIKTLMPRNRWIAQGYLFQLLYAMPAEEQHALRALLARSHRSREALGQEKHQLDRALALYIWTGEHRQNVRAVPRRLAAKSTIWQYFDEKFPNQHDAIAEWQHLMHNGKKGFYRSLLLIRGAELLKRHVTTLCVVPLTTRSQRVYPAHNLRFAVPIEFSAGRTAAKPR